MRILCISDTTRSLAFSSRVKEIYKDVDLILSCGDMPLESYDYVTTMLNRDLCYVYGNHNLKDFNKVLSTRGLLGVGPHETENNFKFYGFMIDGKCYRDKKSGLLIAGLGGSMKYNGGDSQYTEREMKFRILKLVPQLLYNKRRYGRYLDILITHAPPFGLGDAQDLCHRGFECFLGFIDQFQPKYLLHGHVHLDDYNAPRENVRGKTKIINVYGAHLLDDESLGKKKERGC
jgi:uncharacterized protein